MRRRLFKLATCLSLVLLAATVALWVWSYWRTDELALTYRGDGAEQFRSRRGTIAFIHTVFRADAKRGSVGAIKLTTDPDQSGVDGVFVLRGFATRHEWHGFSYDTLDRRGLAEAGMIRAALLAQYATIDDYIVVVGKREEAATDPKVRAQLARMQQDKLRDQSNLTSIGPIPNAPQWRIAAPIWSLIPVFSLLPLLWLTSLALKRGRKLRGLCAECGYNLTGNLSGVCPECGAACKAADRAGASPAAGD